MHTDHNVTSNELKPMEHHHNGLGYILAGWIFWLLSLNIGAWREHLSISPVIGMYPIDFELMSQVLKNLVSVFQLITLAVGLYFHVKGYKKSKKHKDGQY